VGDLQLRSGLATDVGLVRTGNEDSSLVAATTGLWAVADGMGGHRAGEVASDIAVRTLQEVFPTQAPDESGLAAAAAAANDAIRAAADEDPELHGMGTTLVALARTDGDDLVYLNVGDSRIYLLRGGELERLTIDHSLVEELVQEGSLTPEEARSHPKRNIVTRALGIYERVAVDTATITPAAGDRFLLCSDGLTDELDEDRTASVLRRLSDPDEAAAELVRLALESGGRDNVTVLIVDVVDDGGQALAASAAIAGGTASSRSTASATQLTRRERRRADATTSTTASAPRRVTWRVGVFAVLVVAVLAAAAGAIGWYARNTYYVGVTGESVTIFKGKPGGVLWFDPTVEDVTDFTTADVSAAAQDDVARGVEFGSLSEAEEYVQRVTATSTTSTTSTTSSTTSSTTTTLGATTLPAPPP
jgi:protein phosphatase